MRLFTILLLFFTMTIRAYPAPEHFITYDKSPSRGHLQGIAGNGKFIFRVFNYGIVKSDMTGKTLKTAECRRKKNQSLHAGSPCLVNDKLYVPCCFGSFNRDLNGKPSLNYIQVFDLDLNYIKSFHIPELQHGAGCITFADGRFFIAGGRPYQRAGNTIYEYDTNFRFIRKHELALTTYVGIQTLAFDGRDFLLGCYGNNGMSYKLSRDFKNISYYSFNSAIGLIPLSADKMLVSMQLGDHRAKFIDPEKYLLQKKYIDLDKNGIAFFEGRKFIDLSKLKRISRKYSNTVFVIRCSKLIPLECFIAAKQYFPVNHVIKITD